MRGLRFDLACICGGELELVTQSQRSSLERRAVVHCPDCDRDLVLMLGLVVDEGRRKAAS